MRRTGAVVAAWVLGAGAALGGCGDDDGAAGGDGGGGSVIDGTPAGSDGATEACVVRGTDLGLQPVADGFENPVFVTSPPGDLRLFVVEQAGVIRIIAGDDVLATPFIDLRARVVAEGEQGLLGLAFHPDFAQNGRFFVYYTAVESEEAGPEANVIAELRVSPGDPDVADPDFEERVIEVPDYAPNHNGGMIAFGADRYLYAGFGDGGASADPRNNGQDKSSLLGDMIRIDVEGGSPYSIPPDNPFAGSPGGERPEIWLSGLRNPWRWSFDRATGDLYIGDVGQVRWEEIDVLPAGQAAGANLGWDEVEGDECFDDPVTETDPGADPDCVPGDYTAPVVAHFHDPILFEGHRAITGGYVYRGACYPDIAGWYFYADHRTAQVFKLVYQRGAATEQEEITDDVDPDRVLRGIASFGEDDDGDLYVVARGPGAVYRLIVE